MEALVLDFLSMISPPKHKFGLFGLVLFPKFTIWFFTILVNFTFPLVTIILDHQWNSAIIVTPKIPETGVSILTVEVLVL